MKISNQTLTILKNFASINEGIVVKKGSALKTTDKKYMVAEANVEEKFPKDFAIYDLNQFLSVVSLFEEPDFKFGSTNVVISEGTCSTTYVYANPEMIVSSDKKIEVKNPAVSFQLTNKDLQHVLGAAKAMALPEIVVQGDGEKILLVATDTKNPSTNVYTVDLETATDKTFQFIFKTEWVKVLPLDYEVNILAKGIAKFSHKDVLEYVICATDESTYGEKSE